MKIIVILILLLPFRCWSVSLEPADELNEKYAILACERLGDECEKARSNCGPKDSPMPNTCIALNYISLEVAKELCGLEHYKDCYNSNNEYRIKWMHELNLPNIGHPKRDIAFRECKDVGYYPIKSTELKEFEFEVLQVFKHIRNPIDTAPPSYQKQKELYECFKKHLQ